MTGPCCLVREIILHYYLMLSTNLNSQSEQSQFYETNYLAKWYFKLNFSLLCYFITWLTLCVKRTFTKIWGYSHIDNRLNMLKFLFWVQNLHFNIIALLWLKDQNTLIQKSHDDNFIMLHLLAVFLVFAHIVKNVQLHPCNVLGWIN